jgi:hypothetical protein
MIELYHKSVEILLAWMPVIVQITILSYIMYVLRNNYFSHEEAKKSEKINNIRKSMPFWPLLAGAIWGAIPHTPKLWFVTSYVGGIQQGLCAGMLSMFLPWIIEVTLKKKGIEIRPDLPGDSVPPSKQD